MRLPPGAFTPPPQVHSAIVEFRIKEGCRFSIHHLPTFEAVIRASFGQRRKMIRSALISGLRDLPADVIENALREAGVSPSARAETIPIDRFVEIANNLPISQET